MSYTLPNKQTFDLVYDKIVELLELYSDSMPKLYQFSIIRDNPRAVTDFTGRGIFLHWAGNTDYKNNRGQYDYTAKYYLDCLSAMQGQQASTEYTSAGEIAAKSTRYLVTQVFDVFTHYVNDNFGFPVGTIGNRRMYIEQADPYADVTERPVSACRVVLEVAMSDTPQTDKGVDLESILVTQSQTPAWASLIDYQEVDT